MTLFYSLNDINIESTAPIIATPYLNDMHASLLVLIAMENSSIGHTASAECIGFQCAKGGKTASTMDLPKHEEPCRRIRKRNRITYSEPIRDFRQKSEENPDQSSQRYADFGLSIRGDDYLASVLAR